MTKRGVPLRAGYTKRKTAPKIDNSALQDALDNFPFAEISPNLHVRVSSRAKRLSLRLDPSTHRIILSVPRRVSARSAYQFAIEYKTWITDKLSELPQAAPFIDGQILPIFGQEHHLSIQIDNTLKFTDISLKNNEIIVQTNKKDPSARLRRFFIQMAEERITPLAHEKALKTGKKIKNITVKDTKSRWGSCSSDCQLSFSYRLIFAPPESLDYVVAHEVAHLVHMDHSPKFWEICNQLCNHYEYGKGWMRENGQDLMRFGIQPTEMV